MLKMESVSKDYTLRGKTVKALDGVSLTVGESGKDSFKVYIIPHTLKETTIGKMISGCRVNIEFDIKYCLKRSIQNTFWVIR